MNTQEKTTTPTMKKLMAVFAIAAAAAFGGGTLLYFPDGAGAADQAEELRECLAALKRTEVQSEE